MGSREEFEKAVKFVDQHKIEPVVSEVLDGLEHAEKGFEILKEGGQFGKVSRLSSLKRFASVLCRRLMLSSRRSSSTLIAPPAGSCRGLRDYQQHFVDIQMCK